MRSEMPPGNSTTFRDAQQAPKACMNPCPCWGKGGQPHQVAQQLRGAAARAARRAGEQRRPVQERHARVQQQVVDAGLLGLPV